MSDATPKISMIDREALFEQYRPFVYSIAGRIMKSLSLKIDIEELASYGTIGLLEAAERYDARRGVSFSTFSHYRIKGAIYDGLREMGIITRQGSARARWEANANDLIQSAADDNGANAENTSISVDDEIHAVEKIIDELIPAYFLSLDADESPEIADSNALPSELLEQKDMYRVVLQLVNSLPEDEKKLVERLYFKQISMTEIGKEMGITKSWVSRLHTKAIRRLRERLEEIGVIAPSG
jgi:RNA polymerase sigma factor FliA